MAEIYSDFLKDFNPHPTTKDLLRFTDEKAVIRSIRALLMTNKGERPFQPDLGGNLRAMLFEQMSVGTAEMIKQEITRTITRYEPRAKLTRIVVTPFYDFNRYDVTIVFMIINRNEEFAFNVTLDRVR